MDARAQIGIVRLFASLAVGAILIWVVNAVTAPLYDYTGNQSQDTVATTGTQYLQAAGDFIPLFYLFVAFFGMIALAVFTREVLR